MKKAKYFFLILLFICSILTNAQLPVWFDGAFSLSIPAGGNRFNAYKSHFPGISCAIGAQTTWNQNWFDMDSLIIGAEFSTHYFNARNKILEENLRFNSLFIGLSRYFTLDKLIPFANVSIGMSTMNTSQGSFVLSMGGVIRGGFYLIYPKFSPGFSIGYNAPWIAYHNTLTGFWELGIHIRFLSNIKIPQKKRDLPSYSTE